MAGLQRSLRYGARVEAGLVGRSLAHCLGEIVRTEGAAGLWKGAMPSVVKAAPSAAITFTVYEVLIGLMVAAQAAAERKAAAAAAAAAAPASGKKRR